MPASSTMMILRGRPAFSRTGPVCRSKERLRCAQPLPDASSKHFLIQRGAEQLHRTLIDVILESRNHGERRPIWEN